MAVLMAAIYQEVVGFDKHKGGLGEIQGAVSGCGKSNVWRMLTSPAGSVEEGPVHAASQLRDSSTTGSMVVSSMMCSTTSLIEGG